MVYDERMKRSRLRRLAVVLAGGVAIGTSTALVTSVDAGTLIREPTLLRLPQAVGTSKLGPKRLHGYAQFKIPAGWHSRQRGNAEVELRRSVSVTCPVRAYIYSIATISRLGARAQLQKNLPSSAEPGQPATIGPVQAVGQGRIPRLHGVWGLVAPPNNVPAAFTLYGAALLPVTTDHWAGLAFGLSASKSCREAILKDRANLQGLEQMLAGTRLHDARYD
jgi:hypothetical protein